MRTDSKIILQKALTTNIQDKIFEAAEEYGKIMFVSSGACWNSNGGSQRPQQIAEGLKDKAAIVHLNYTNSRNLVYPNLATDSKNNIVGWLQHIPHGVKKIYSAAIPYEDDAQIIQRLGDDWTVHYDCVDDWAGFASAKEWYHQNFERIIVRRSDLITSTGRTMMARICDMQEKLQNPNIRWLPNSTALDIDKIKWEKERSTDIVYIGYLLDEWIDFELMEKLSQKYTLKIIGSPPNPLPFENKNVNWVGKIDKKDIIKNISNCKIGIVPFTDTRLTYAVDPIKYYDYLAAGLPTVASFMPELEERAHAYVTYNHNEFIEKCDDLLDSVIPHAKIGKAIEGNCYTDRVKKLWGWINESLR